MVLTEQEKSNIKRELVESLCHEPEVTRIIVFGSFLTTNDPDDLDVAVFQTSDQSYLPLDLRYRSRTRNIASRIALDILPIKADAQNCLMLEAICSGRSGL